MEATYCMGSDVDVCRMFDQYLYKRPENLDLSLSVPPPIHENGYMADQTFHTPSFGDEEFDIPPINPHSGNQDNSGSSQNNMASVPNYQQTPMSLACSQPMSQTTDSLSMSEPAFPPPLYLSGMPEHTMGISATSSSYSNQQPTYTMASPSQLIMHQQHQHSQMMLSHQGMSAQQYGRSPHSSSPPGQETTSDDSDDSTPHAAMMAGMKRPSPEPADNCLAKVQKKPKVQKKKKKRDPNEPQKPVSAYALFFRDTQAAIKGQNPNASFGEVSKIVASMWDALDAEHKNVYKKKTEAAKKEYLKALAAYRASLVSKGAGESDNLYSNYGNYGGGYTGYSSPPTNMASPPLSSASSVQQQMSPMAKKSPLLSSLMTERANNQQQAMMGSSLSQMGQVPSHMPPGMSPPGARGQMGQSHMQPQVSSAGYMQQVNPTHMSSPPEHMVSSPPPHQLSAPVRSPPLSAGPPHLAQQSLPGLQQHLPATGRPPNPCIRSGCTNPAVPNSEWEDEYCSNECVVSHCRDVFSSWVASNQAPSQNFSTVK